MDIAAIRRLRDEELVSIYISSQKNLYFEEIYERYANKVFRKCYSFVYNKEKAEDYTHDIFLKLIVKIGTFKETSKFSTWLYSITYNYCMDQVRSGKKQKETPMEENIEIADNEEDYEEIDFQSEELNKSLRKLNKEDQVILEMKYQEDFSIREIAESLNISESAVKMRLLRAKDKLKKLYLENIALFVLIVVKILSVFEK